MSKFNERVAKEREELKSKVFSKTNMLDLMAEYLNDNELESHTMVTRKGVATKIKTMPGKEFRKFLVNILVSYGVSKDDAQSMMSEYKFKAKDLGAVSDFFGDFLGQYLTIGRKVQLFNMEDVSGGLLLEDVPASYKEIKDPSDREGAKPKKYRQTKQHRKLKAKNSKLGWLMEEGPDQSSLVRVMEMALDN